MTERKPLPYPHDPPPGYIPGCCNGEDNDPNGCDYSVKECPGCRVALAALVVVNPFRMGLESETGKRMTALEGFRRGTDETDPLRITVERELVRRGIG